MGSLKAELSANAGRAWPARLNYRSEAIGADIKRMQRDSPIGRALKAPRNKYKMDDETSGKEKRKLST